MRLEYSLRFIAEALQLSRKILIVLEILYKHWCPRVSCGLSLTGMRVLVTASSRGLGYSTASFIGRCGAEVVINSRDDVRLAEALQRLKESNGRAHGVRADLGRTGEAARLVREAAKAMNGLDAIVYVPPPPPAGRFWDLSMEDWRLSYRLLVEAPIEAVREAVPYLERSINPSIVFVTSIAALEPRISIVSSSVLRPSLHSLTMVLARELGGKGVRVNSVAPGYFLTDRLLSIARRRAEAEGRSVNEILDDFSKQTALGRVGNPEELAKTIAFLVSPQASYITGAIIRVTGGLHVSTR